MKALFIWRKPELLAKCRRTSVAAMGQEVAELYANSSGRQLDGSQVHNSLFSKVYSSTLIFPSIILLLTVPLAPYSLTAQEIRKNWDPPAIQVSPNHDDVVHDSSLLEKFIDAGRQLFRTQFNIVDGGGRPEATGDSKPTIRTRRNISLFSRIAGADANSCAGCHNQPSQGGAGEFSANVFVGAHFTDPPTNSADPRVTNERNTISIFGAGVIEMLAREITEDLLSLRNSGLAKARKENTWIEVPLHSKGVSFGSIIVRPDGTYDAKGVHGLDEDLIVKPFGMKGVAVSIREFTIFALNQHHGIQAQERFGWERTGVKDFDGDGVEVEFTAGQVSALTLYQASLTVPVRLVPKDQAAMRQWRLGELKFREVRCSECHIPDLPLRARSFTEPNPFNRPGSLIPADVEGQIRIPLESRDGSGLFEGPDGFMQVAAFSDLKRHKICDDDDPHFCNETLPQDFVPTDEFLTSKLWDIGTSAPYGHRGDLTTVSEAIIHHSGEAKASKKAFLALSDEEKSAMIAFLLSLRVQVEEPEKLTKKEKNK